MTPAQRIARVLTPEPQTLISIVGASDVHPVRAAILLGRLCGDEWFRGMAVRDGDGWRLRDEHSANDCGVGVGDSLEAGSWTSERG